MKNKKGQFTKEVAKTKKESFIHGLRLGFFFGAWVVFVAALLAI